jgi:hypothetical protein
MLKIYPISDPERLREVCDVCAVRCHPGMLAYEMNEDDELIGMCRFRLTDAGGEIHELTLKPGASDDEALIILNNAALSFLLSCGAVSAAYRTPPESRINALMAAHMAGVSVDIGAYLRCRG